MDHLLHQEVEEQPDGEMSSIDSEAYMHITLNIPHHPTTSTSSLALSPPHPVSELSGITMTETHIFPTILPDWSNLGVLHRNTLPPRATFFLYNSPEDALTRDVSKAKALSLSGTWKFSLAKSPFDVPEDFYSLDYDTARWGDIQVPGMWQLQGYGKGPHYTNMIYPFPLDPPHVPYDDNETGCYTRTFRVPESFKDHQLRLRFEGVDSSFHIWVNGQKVGYSQGSRNPSEFDISSFVKEKGENTLAVQVYQFCDGSYIEDQDQWWLSGIFRDVHLLAFPKVHFRDFHVQTPLDSEYKDATLSVEVDLNTKAEVKLQLLDPAGKTIATASQTANPSTTFKISIEGPAKWTAETPTLYKLILSTAECSVHQRVGFRVSELKDGVFVVNGKPVKFRGTNRHEHHPDHGRAVPFEFMRNDLLLMKTHNINAIRTSHQLNDPRLYDLADELGLWIMDECDLECHGFGEVDEITIPPQLRDLPDVEKAALRSHNPNRWASDNPAWKQAYLDRARQAVYRDKNHPCVIIWSLGNESFYGRNHQAMYDLIHAYDPTRLIHYEADHDAKTVDIYSRMYSSVDEITDFATKTEKWEKPLVMCEYVHAMGNGPGNIREYIETFYKYPRLMGGFVWEWANHGLRTKTPDGIEYYGYGGDFGDEPNDGHSVLDGVLFSDHTPNPGLLEYGKAIEPVQVLGGTKDKVKIINRYDHVTLDHLRCDWSLVSDSAKKSIAGCEVVIPKDIQPGQTIELQIEGVPTLTSEEAYLELSFTLRHDTNWAKAGHEVAFGQVQLAASPKLELLKSLDAPTAPTCIQISPQLLSITANRGMHWSFNIVHGKLMSWKNGSGHEFIRTPPEIDLYRAITDNDMPKFGKVWQATFLDKTKCHVRSVFWSYVAGVGLVIVVNTRIAPPVLEWSIDAIITYTFTTTGLSIKVKGETQGQNLPHTFARLGITISLNDIETATWFGRGPGESYRDKKLSQRMGTYSAPTDDLYTNYEFPQESGNRTDTRWVHFKGPHGGLKASFGDLEDASFTALHYSTRDLDDAKHPYDLIDKKKKETIVRLDWAHHGIGTGSCGPATLPEYALESKGFEYEIFLQ